MADFNEGAPRDSRPLRVYLDVCCLSRLTDDQSQSRVRKEADAVELVLAAVREGKMVLVSSEALSDEVRRNPSLERRAEAETLLSLANERIEIDDEIARRAKELSALGYGAFDALHIAAAEFASADVMLTTDDQLLRRTGRGLGRPRVRVENPLSWIKEQDP